LEWGRFAFIPRAFQSDLMTNGASQYYDEVGNGYLTWSRRLNIHFGYYRRGMNPFDLEAMLTQMNREVLRRLNIQANENAIILDAGCGVGESMRYMARLRPLARFHGATISPWQVATAQKINRDKGLGQQIAVQLADFQALPYPSGFAHAAFAIESAVYAAGADKARFLAEMARVLKPGGKLVVADGFRKNTKPFPLFFDKIYRASLAAWAIDELGDIRAFEQKMRELGFEKIKVENLGWRVLPSALHVPFTMLKLFWAKLFHPKKGSSRYLKALLLSTVMGMLASRFGYYLVSAEKGNNR
jgi:ubiquinone/menaquinone biosynthesis C-methylase UbiE